MTTYDHRTQCYFCIHLHAAYCFELFNLCNGCVWINNLSSSCLHEQTFVLIWVSGCPFFWSNYSDLTRPHPKRWFSVHLSIPLLGIQSHSQNCNGTYYSEEVTGHPFLIIWEYEWIPRIGIGWYQIINRCDFCHCSVLRQLLAANSMVQGNSKFSAQSKRISVLKCFFMHSRAHKTRIWSRESVKKMVVQWFIAKNFADSGLVFYAPMLQIKIHNKHDS